jgi:hypothetical protein
VAQLYGTIFGFAVYEFGPHASMITGVILFAGVVLGYTLFDRLLVTLGLVSFLTIFCGTTAAEQLGFLPYAPLLTAPFQDGRLATSWLRTAGGIAIILMLSVFGLLNPESGVTNGHIRPSSVRWPAVRIATPPRRVRWEEEGVGADCRCARVGPASAGCVAGASARWRFEVLGADRDA